MRFLPHSSYHTHTAYCDGKDTIEEIVQEAIRLGCPEIGFSGHGYTDFDESYCMSLATTEQYKAEIRALREKYKDRISVRLGIEKDYFSKESNADYDYVIGSMHYVCKDGLYLVIDECPEQMLSAVKNHFDGDFYAYAAAYYRQMATLYEKTACDIVGHFDLVTKYNEGDALFSTQDPRYRRAVADALDALRTKPVMFEINYGAISRGYRTEPYPSKEIRKALKQYGIPLLPTSDSHDKHTLLFFEDYEHEKKREDT